MMEAEQTQKKNAHNWLKNLLVGLLVLLMLLAGSIAMYKQERTLRSLREEASTLEEKKKKTELDVEYMDRLLKYTQSEEYIEQEARRILGWIREDERVFIDPDGDKEATPPVPTPSQDDPSMTQDE